MKIIQILAILILGFALGKSAQLIKTQFFPEKNTTDASNVLLDEL